MAIPVRVQCLDDDYQPIGERFAVVTRDISCSGMGFFHTQPMKSGWIRICLTTIWNSDEMNLLAYVEHCTRCGDFYIMGCRIEDVSAA